jgi:hypothetical protein
VRGTALAAVAALGLAGCEDREVHVFSAQRYDPDRSCLEDPVAIDVLEGPDPGPCDDVRCWNAPSGDALITTAACNAPPDYEDGTADPAGSRCAAALAALESGAWCET